MYIRIEFENTDSHATKKTRQLFFSCPNGMFLTSSKSYLVIPPSCPHMNASLCDGFFDGEVLTCEKHLWQWNGSSGTAMGIAELPLNIYESTLKDGCLHVNFMKELKYAYLD